MLLPNDDDTAHVDNIYLGPRGWALPWQARYSAYGVGLALALAAFTIESRIGIRMSPWSIIWTVIIIVALTRWIGRQVSFETPLAALLMILRHELTAPRPPSKQHTASIRPGKLRNRWKGIRIRESRH